jgi:hypothetical protein
MPTPSIQTLVTDAQQILNLDSISAVRSVVAVALANANTGTPLNPNLTTQQLWNEFYQVVNKPKSDIESIIANQLMKLLYAPPAPGGAGANKQVIFNDGGVLAGDAGFTYDKATDALKIAGLLGIGGDGISPLTVYAAASAKATAMLLTTVGSPTYGWDFSVDGAVNGNLFIRRLVAGTKTDVLEFDRANGNVGFGISPSAKLDVSADDGTIAIFRSSGGLSNDKRLTISTGGAKVVFNISDNNNTAIARAYEFQTAGTAVMSLSATGDLTALLGNVVMGTSGKGIDFSATPSGSGTMTSELFNDYEEGTWTGTLKGSVSDPTTPVTATGRYTKVGRQVSVQIEFNNVSTAGASGNVFVIGLPFSNSSIAGCAGSVITFLTATFTETLGCIIGGLSTAIDIYSVKSNSSWVAATHNAGTGRYLWLNITYTV